MRRHGFVFDLNDQLRACRFYCSNRNGNQGCGRTRSVYLADAIPNHTGTTTEIFFLISLIATTGFVFSGWKKAREMAGAEFTFSLSSAYRWHKLFYTNLSHYRSKLFLQVKPPPDKEIAASPNPELVTTLKMFDEAHEKGNQTPISSYQLYHQTSIF